MRRPLIIISITVALLLISAGVGYAMLNDSSATGLPPQNTSPADTTTTPTTTTTTTTTPPTTTTTPPTTTTTTPPTTTTTPPTTTTTTPPTTTTTTPPTTTTTTPPDEPSVSIFEQEIEKLKETITDVAATGQSSEVSLVFSEAAVNDKAAQSLVGKKIDAGIATLEVTDVNLDLQDDNIIAVEIRGNAYGLGIIIRVTAQVSIQAGKLVVGVIDANVSKDLIAGAITQALDSLLIQLTRTGTADDEKVDIEFTDISIQQDEMTLIVMVRPKV